tara:strand:+ start:120 stop:461 length:342 start_codon:yes stop_codon:yes gene_type:complete
MTQFTFDSTQQSDEDYRVDIDTNDLQITPDMLSFSQEELKCLLYYFEKGISGKMLSNKEKLVSDNIFRILNNNVINNVSVSTHAKVTTKDEDCRNFSYNEILKYAEDDYNMSL